VLQQRPEVPAEGGEAEEVMPKVKVQSWVACEKCGEPVFAPDAKLAKRKAERHECTS
jgi:formylmethanofuran dehydrogenase subunit E